MSRRFFAVLAIAALAGTGGLAAQTFSLDDDPSAPLTGAPAVPPFLSAEDPLAMGSPCVGAGLLGPSPSLAAGPFFDSDMLLPGLGLDFRIPQLFYVGAISGNHRGIDASAYPELPLRFSVDRCTGGLAGTASGWQAANNQQPGDLFESEILFRHPSVFAGTLGGCFAGDLHGLAGVFGSNFQVHNQDFFGLVPFVASGVVAGPIGPGTHDNLDAYNDYPVPALDVDGDNVQDFEAFFAMLPAESALSATSPADIFRLAPGAPGWGGAPPWAPAPSMCLDNFGRDCIDGLTVWNYNTKYLDPGIDVALFSLCPSSPTLGWLQGMGWPVDGGTVFLTDFTGNFGIYAFSVNLGLTTPYGPQWSNVDALEVRH